MAPQRREPLALVAVATVGRAPPQPLGRQPPTRGPARARATSWGGLEVLLDVGRELLWVPRCNAVLDNQGVLVQRGCAGHAALAVYIIICFQKVEGHINTGYQITFLQSLSTPGNPASVPRQLPSKRCSSN